MQGQLLESVYDRFDTNADGDISYNEFTAGAMRLLLPVSWQVQLQAVQGWPGWPAFNADGFDAKVAAPPGGHATVACRLHGGYGTVTGQPLMPR